MQKVRALIVDDSGFFRRRIRDMLTADPAIEVVGEAANGREAVEQVVRLRPDVVTMDIEMPELDGISAVREIMRRRPTPVLMFSSLTFEGAKATLDALDAGAVDFLPKRFSDISVDAAKARQQLQQRVKAVVKGGQGRTPTPASPAARNTATSAAASTTAPTTSSSRGVRAADLDLVIIGASTGGPMALQRVLTGLPANFPVPILLVQHMPANFTKAFAQRVDGLCAISVREAVEGDSLQAGQALLAPGGRHLGVVRKGAGLGVRLVEPREGQFYKPSVDIAFASAAEVAPGKVLAIVLTGMGADGCEGAKRLRQTGAHIWAQDEASSVIYGMPQAVARAGVVDRVLSLDNVADALKRLR
ncbi:two-component system chemotaxis response regulator CheB [Natronocella acetinitrilica]|uniref:Protein-glutamate methylesterase/protein-glutamine glutaminase n=1 Tax=Natronocella acetinitrilica TaxID=414046 RepID=A0AAE3G709_9GAMM|nr:chemotaxis response regulator protein-glutamate methylesterase [Natronocella acetinitrilica]MCP1675583.1 two-component system chemotaxis response regulator CheB [Natronocella acetinitrilica]